MPVQDGASSDGSHWWSDADNDPWRNPHTPAMLVTPTAPPYPSAPGIDSADDPALKRRLWTIAGVTTAVALMAGVVGGAVGVRFGGSGLSKSTLGAVAGAPRPAPESLAGVARVVLPSVVTIRMTVVGGTSLGSGFVVTGDGYLITNDHVVAGGSGMATVTFEDGTSSPAKLVGADPESDVAVLKVMQHKGLTPAVLGDSDTLAVGDAVVAVGSPLALQGTVTAGIVSAVDRPIATGSMGGASRYYAAIQTDAAINHGNSGGPLVDAAGQVVGINSVIKSLADDEDSAGNIGLAFAIPINHARRVAEEIISTGRAHRTVIGAELEDSKRGHAGGVKLRTVMASGPAAAAGLREGDVVVAFNGRPLQEPTDLIALVRKTAPGQVVKLSYKRGATSNNAQVKLVADTD